MRLSQWDKVCDKATINKWLYNKANLSGPVQQWLLNRMREWPKGTTFLDAGCGAGATAFMMRRAKILDNIKYTGIDSSKLMLKIAQEKVKHPNVNWLYGSLEEFDTGIYDNISIKSVLAHILHPEFVIKNLSKRLASNGTMYILFWINPIDGESKIHLNEDNFYVNAHSRQTLLEAIKEADLHLVKEHSVKQKDGLKNPTRTNWVIRRNK
jgi:ubiquinone/menaquinone biosynthesis C-methylase UbiE